MTMADDNNEWKCFIDRNEPELCEIALNDKFSEISSVCEALLDNEPVVNFCVDLMFHLDDTGTICCLMNVCV